MYSVYVHSMLIQSRSVHTTLNARCVLALGMKQCCTVPFVYFLYFFLPYPILLTCRHRARVQTIVIYPKPSVYTCTARTWLREIGFSLTYGALMLKTWRYIKNIHSPQM